MCIDIVDKRKEYYRSRGEDYRQPWIVLMTDGLSTDTEEDQDNTIKSISTLINNKKLVMLPMGIGEGYDKKFLKRFNNKFSIDIKDTDSIKEAFDFIAQSAKSASGKKPDESVDIMPHIEDKKGVSIEV